MVDTDKLKGIVVGHGEKLGDLASTIGISQSALSYILGGKREFTRAEIELIMLHYDMDWDELHAVFFPKIRNKKLRRSK